MEIDVDVEITPCGDSAVNTTRKNVHEKNSESVSKMSTTN
jgi:hypothetical protein